MHFYVYSFREWRYRERGATRTGAYVFERTCGTEKAAKEWVDRYGPRAIYLIGHTIRGAFY